MEKLDSIINGLRNARAGVESGTTLLVNGAGRLGSAILHDTTTLLAKVPGHFFDYNKAATCSATDEQIDGIFKLVESMTGKHFSSFKESTKCFFDSGIGLSPKETFILIGAMCGAGQYGGAISKFADSELINNMSSVLAHFAPFIDNPSAVVVGALAVTVCTAVKVWIGLRGMVAGAGFEGRRDKELEVIKALDKCAAANAYSSPVQNKELEVKLERFKKKFDVDLGLSQNTVDDIGRMRLSGASEGAIESRIQQSPDEGRWVKQINDLLTKEHRMSSAKAATVTHDLLIKTGGDIPLITSKLASRAVPKAWIEEFGFDKKYLVSEEKVKDRHSQLLKLGADAVLVASDFLSATTERVQNHYGRKSEVESAVEEPAKSGKKKDDLRF